MNPLVEVSSQPDANGHISYYLWCPGCDDLVRINDTWQFNGNVECPSFSPSLLTQYGHIKGVERRCHAFIQAGRWEFLSDSTHALAGQIVPMVPLPDWFVNRQL